MNRRRPELATAVVLAVLSAILALPLPAGARTPEGSSPETLGRGRIGKMHWAAGVEVTSEGTSHEANQVCVIVQTIEPGVRGRTEGSEVTNCGNPSQGSVDEVARSPYGVVVAAVFSTDAKSASIAIKGEATQRVHLKHRTVDGAADPVSYLARGFDPRTCIKQIRAFNSKGAVVATISSGRCLG